MIKTIAFDADDTLWHNERIFISAKAKYKKLLSRYHEQDWIEARLDATEMRNIKHFGYGIKGFTLSMIETAVELTEGRVKGNEITDIISYAKDMMSSPIEVLEGVSETIERIYGDYRLMVITKGDLFDQEAKIARSGLGKFFSEVEIVSEKNKEVYERIVLRYGIIKNEFVMIGNSLKSDILPVIDLGSTAVHIPYETEWFHDAVDPQDLENKDFVRLENMSHLVGWLEDFAGK